MEMTCFRLGEIRIGFQQIYNYYDGNVHVWKFPVTLVTSIGKLQTGPPQSSNFEQSYEILQGPSKNLPSFTQYFFGAKFQVLEKVR